MLYRSALILGLTTIILFITITSVSYLIMLGSFSDLEKTKAKDIGTQTSVAIQDLVNNLEILTKDYSEWTETTYFIVGQSPSYTKDNFSDTTFINLNINLVNHPIAKARGL